MKRLNKGPDLKMPDLKAPDFLKDVFYDLHDRRLLAPLALVIVAIAAVPFLLGGGSEDSDTAPVTGAATLPGEPEAGESAKFTVVEAKPGLRDYRKRLASRKPVNPFKQRYTSAKVEGAELSQGDESSSTVGTVTASSAESSTPTASPGGSSTVPSGVPTPSPSPSPSPTPSAVPSPGDGGGHHRLTYYTYAIDVRIVQSGGQGSDSEKNPEPVVKERILPLTPIPGEKAPVVTYMGSAGKGELALLMVSNDVKAVSGDGKCASAEDVCQLLAVQPGAPETFIYGYNETRYTIRVLKIEAIVTGHG